MTLFRIRSNEEVAKNTYELRLEGSHSLMQRAGQFVNVAIPGYFLRRPLSPSDWNDHEMRLFYKVVGHGTETLSQKKSGELDLLTGLGNGFDTTLCGDHIPVLIGGGVGVPPLYRLAQELVEEGKRPLVLLGFQSADEVFLADDFEKLGAEVRLSTADGSRGTKGFVTELFTSAIEEEQRNHPDAEPPIYVYTCGPLPMFRAVVHEMNRFGIDGSFSLEERMGCGLGICLGCSVSTTQGPKEVCKDGPVFPKEVLPWAKEA